MDSGFCVECLEQALQVYEKPEIFNTDQGSQFTSEAIKKLSRQAYRGSEVSVSPQIG